MEVNNSFPKKYRSNQAVHYKGNRFVVITSGNVTHQEVSTVSSVLLILNICGR